MFPRPRSRPRGGKSILPGLCTLGFWLSLAVPALAADYVFTDAGAIFGHVKGHFGRSNAWGDLDGDGLYDLITGAHDRGLLAFRQVSPLQFERVDQTNGLATTEPLYGIVILDFDRDGDNDVFLNHVGFSTDLYRTSTRYMRNNGDGTFWDSTNRSGVSSFGHGFALVPLDYDKDGWVDVYVVNHDGPNILFRNDQQGGFLDVTIEAGVAAVNGRRGRSTSATSLDFDRDGWMDLYVAQRDNPDSTHPTGNNHLLRNQGDGTFVNVAAEAGVLGYGKDFVATAGDVNGDNWTDLYIATFNFGPNGYPETQIPNRLYLNNGDGTFSDVTRSARVGYAFGTMGLGFEDHDNDGNLDLYLGTGGPFDLQVEDQIFYWNRGDLQFTNSTVEKGLLDDARGHGISVFDYDRDGDLDIFSSMGGHSAGSERVDILYLNSGGAAHWLEVRLVGEDCPLEGLGSRLVLRTADREIWRWVRSSGGFDAFEPPHVWFGLGSTDRIEELEVHWPCGRIQALAAPATDQHLELHEADANVSLLPPVSPPPSGAVLALRAGPSPFVDRVRFEASLAGPEPSRLRIFDLRGRLVRERVLVAGPAGEAVWIWDGRDRRNDPVAAGRYLVELRQAGVRATASVVRVR